MITEQRWFCLIYSSSSHTGLCIIVFYRNVKKTLVSIVKWRDFYLWLHVYYSRYSSLINRRAIVIMLVVCWTLPFIICTPIYTYAAGRDDVINGETYVIRLHRRMVICLYVTNVVVLSSLYGTIFWRTRRQAQKVTMGEGTT